MLTISAPCPRCLQPHTTLVLAFADPAINNIAERRKREAAFRCVHCHRLVAVTLSLKANIYLGPAVAAGLAPPPSGDIGGHPEIGISEIAPKMPVDRAPEFCPKPVAGAFLDGCAVLSQARWTAAASCFRIAIDRASKLLWSEHSLGDDIPHNLGKRIQKLGQKLGVPQSLIEWLEVVKAVGNDQHEVDDVSEDDARDAAHFAEVFLTYTYTLPIRLAKFQARRDQEDATTVTPA